ncbi:MAG: divalent-cation tolerance protein CutA [Deltaproteobacteria bacterium]|nr:divalent-cation tolerance protein CutA [Deltaproteobacteria bacterium]
MQPAPEVRVVLVTCPPAASEQIARSIVDGGFAACVNIVPGIRSIYRWKGEVCDEPEDLLVVKTAAAGVDDLVAHVKSIHSYTVPEIVALPVVAGNRDYLEWVAAETSVRR